MRNESAAAVQSQLPLEAPPAAENGSGKIAKDFVRWCWSLGPDFRNSPDAANLRFWMKRNKMKAANEDDVLAEARRLFMKKLEQALRKSQASDPLA